MRFCSDGDIHIFNTQNLLSLYMLCSWLAYKEAKKERKKASKKTLPNTQKISLHQRSLRQGSYFKKALARKILSPCYSFQVYFKHRRESHGTRLLTFSINRMFFHTFSSPWLSLLDVWNTFCIRSRVLMGYEGTRSLFSSRLE